MDFRGKQPKIMCERIELGNISMPDTMSVTAKDVMIVDLSGEAVILNMDNWVYYGLNGMGYKVWNLIQEPKRIDEIKSMILGEYDVDSEICEQDLLAFICAMENEGLVETK